MASTQPLVSNPKQDAGPTILGATLAMSILAVGTMAARAAIRIQVIKNFGWDDGLMTAATVMLIALQAVIIVEVKNGAGRHMGDIPPERIPVGLEYNYISQPLVFECVNTVKLSIGAALLRIAATPFWKNTIWSVMGFMMFYSIGAFFTIVLQCTPVAIQWDPTLKGSCWAPITLQALAYASVAINIVTDLLFAVVIPVPMLWGLQMNRRTKAALIFVLSLGCFACIAAIMRLVSLTTYGKRGDYLWDTKNLTLWYHAEAVTGIVAGSMPALKPMFKRVIGSTRRSRSTSGTPYFRSKSQGVSAGEKSPGLWKSIGSSKPHSGNFLSDDGESQRNLNLSIGRPTPLDVYPLEEYPKNQNAVVTATAQGRDSDSDSDVQNDAQTYANAIRKTTTTQVSYGKY